MDSIPSETMPGSSHYVDRLKRLVQRMSSVRDLPAMMEVVRRGVRELISAHGATFALREGDLVNYADEDAIQPLWKGYQVMHVVYHPAFLPQGTVMLWTTQSV